MDHLDRAEQLVRRYTDLLAVLRATHHATIRANTEKALWDLVEQANAWVTILRENPDDNAEVLHVLEPLSQFWLDAHTAPTEQTWGVTRMNSLEEFLHRNVPPEDRSPR